MQMHSDRRAIDKIYKRRDRYEIPDWQRGKVWGRGRKQALIDTILRDWKLPKFYFVTTSDNPETFDVVDGQQRLNAIFEFFSGDLRLGKESAEAFGGDSYRELNQKFSDAFDDFEIEFDVISNASDADIKLFFQRLQRGMPLTGSEQLNAVDSNLRDFVLHLSQHSFFKHKVAASDARHGYFDIASKVAAIEIEGIDTGLRFDDLKAIFEAHENFSDKSNVANRLTEAFDWLDSAFKSKSELLRNRTIVQSIATLTARLVATRKLRRSDVDILAFTDQVVRELSAQVELGQNATDADYIQFQRTINANIRTGPRTRQEILLRKLLVGKPDLLEVLDPATVAESGFGNTIRNVADSISNLITTVNDRYAADHGTDLFKMTNRSTGALKRIGIVIMDFEGYKSLISELYFIFKEGPGQRLAENIPESFEDVNTLRTGLQHDLDHGKGREAATKRRAIGQVVKKYVGSTSPETISPQRFPVVQISLLKAIESDLSRLTW